MVINRSYPIDIADFDTDDHNAAKHPAARFMEHVTVVEAIILTLWADENHHAKSWEFGWRASHNYKWTEGTF